MSASQSRASTTHRITTAIVSARVVAHFIPVKTTYSGPQLAELYMLKIVYLDGAWMKIVSDRGTQFTSKFWERLHEALDTQLRFSSAYHPQTDGQTERVNQILEDMLRACAL
jgi:transposase InsO family protein